MNYFEREAMLYASAQVVFATLGCDLPLEVRAKVRQAHTLLHDAYFELIRLENEGEQEGID